MAQCFSILDKLAKSKFRAKFKLKPKELEFIKDKGLDKIRSHACDFIRNRVAPAEPVNDGKQTPMRGQPCIYRPTRNRHLLPRLHRKMAPFPKRSRTNSIGTRILSFNNYGMDKTTD